VGGSIEIDGPEVLVALSAFLGNFVPWYIESQFAEVFHARHQVSPSTGRAFAGVTSPASIAARVKWPPHPPNSPASCQRLSLPMFAVRELKETDTLVGQSTRSPFDVVASSLNRWTIGFPATRCASR